MAVKGRAHRPVLLAAAWIVQPGACLVIHATDGHATCGTLGAMPGGT